MRAIFFGTPQFAVPCLEAAASVLDICLVVTQQDKPAGRGRQLTPPAVKERAIKMGIEVVQPRSLKGLSLSADRQLISSNPDTADLVAALNRNSPVDISVVVAYGKIIPQPLLDFPKAGHVNVHASILPRWRGAAPIHWALLSGDSETGVCLMKLEAGLDTGPVYFEARTPITSADTLSSLHDRLSQIGAKLLKEHLLDIASGNCPALPQSELGVTVARKWEKEDSFIDWAEPAAAIVRRIKVANGAFTSFRNEELKVYQASVVTDPYLPPGKPGEIVETNRAEIVVASGGEGYVKLEQLQFPGKKKLDASAVVNGYQVKKGELFGLAEKEL